MPRYLAPKKSSVHRSTCLALYRGLLSRSSCLPLPDTGHDACKRLLRYQFEHNKRLDSPSQINAAVKAAYEALDLVDTASKGNAKSLRRLSAILADAAQLAEERSKFQAERVAAAPPKPVLGPRRIKKAENRRLYSYTGPHPEKTTTIWDRPRPAVRGIRRVPHLVSASGIPFLRYKKPQPPELSRILRYKQMRRIRDFEKLQEMEVNIGFGQLENQWDNIIRDEAGSLKGDVDDDGREVNRDHGEETVRARHEELVGEHEEGWSKWGQQSREYFSTKLRETDIAALERGKKLFDIVLKEKALAQMERVERRRLRVEARRNDVPNAEQAMTEKLNSLKALVSRGKRKTR